MIDHSKLDFLIRSLGLAKTVVAERAAISPQHLSGIIKGNDQPSLEVMSKIIQCLKDAWAERNGVTAPPEVAKIVFEILYPPPPFNPFDGPRKGRPTKEKKASAPDAPAPGLNQQTRTPAASAEPLTQPEPLPEIALPIDAPQSSAARWPYLTPAQRRQMISAIMERGWGQGMSERNVQRKLKQHSGHNCRQRKPDADIAERKDRLANYLLTKVAPVECVGVKGFGDHFSKTTWSSQRPVIEGMLMEEKEREIIKSIYGSLPSLSTIDKIFRERKGVASKLEVASDKLRLAWDETIGFRAEHAGEIMMVDATRLPIQIDGAWGKLRRKGGKDNAGFSHWLHAMLCPESLYTLIYVHSDRSETAAWDRCLEHFLFELNYAPRLLYSDENSKLAHDLCKQKPHEPCTLGPGLRAWLAAGVELLAHTPHRPTAKGAIEAGAMKSGKARLKSLLVARACEKEIPMSSYRHVESQAEWTALVTQWQEMMHARPLRNTGLTRREAFNDDAETASATWRAGRALAPDVRQIYRSITDGVRNAQVAGKLVRLKRAGQRVADAEIVDPDGRLPQRIDGATAVIAPSGMRLGDDPDLSRVIIIDSSAPGQAKFYPAIAKAVRRTFFDRPENQPLYGEHPVRKIQTVADARRAEWHHAKTAEQRLKQGTTDEPVSTGLGNFV